jgi:hypothetical protein
MALVKTFEEDLFAGLILWIRERYFFRIPDLESLISNPYF